MLVEVIGWAGSITVLLAYGLLSTGRLAARSAPYQLLNLGGALGMAINGWAHGALPSVFNNGVWMAIGVLTLGRLAVLRRTVPPHG